MRIPTIVVLLTLLMITATASANYQVRIEGEDCICLGSNYEATITIEPDNPGSETLLGGFDLTISYDTDKMSFLGASAGSFLTDCGPGCTENCGWEYFTYRHWTGYSGCCVGCPAVNTVELIAIADMNNGMPIDASCSDPSQKSTLAVMTFYIAPNNNFDGVFAPLNFYWRPDADTCGNNIFSDKTGYTVLWANSVVDAAGNPFDPSSYCSGPPAGCDTESVVFELDFHGGGVTLGANDRGDMNLNSLTYEIGDAQLYANYFIFGSGVFDPDPEIRARQIAASDINCDDIVLTISDLVYLIRIITGDTLPSDACPPCPRCAPPAPRRVENQMLAATSEIDTLAFFGAEGEPGEQRVPFYIYVANSQDIAGVQARMTYDTLHLSPHFDTAVGDGESIEYDLLSRASAFSSGNRVRVKSYEPGVILINLIPTLAPPVSTITTGSGVILRLYMDVKPPPLPWQPSMVDFVTEGYDYNLFSDAAGFAIWPELVGGEFEVEDGILPPPSCPVLFSFNGIEFVQNDPLLTACEESGYRDVVTDYYHLPPGVAVENGRVRFQLRELEDEITYLDDIELITVDHSAATRIAAGVDGQITSYVGVTAPLSAVDQTGTDRLAEVAVQDGVLFSSNEPGHLVVTFSNSRDALKGYNFPSAQKSRLCFPRIAPPPDDPPEDDIDRARAGFGNEVTIEILDNEGIWQDLQSPPVREVARQEAILSPEAGEIEQEFITIRISWSDHYRVDAVSQFVPADETPIVQVWSVTDDDLSSTGTVSKVISGLGADGRLVLTKGEIYEFSFDTDLMTDADITRDYIIKAVGRYQPDYSVHTQLVPGDFQLYDNFPNPFNPSTRIGFDIPKAIHVNLVVINTLGQIVTTLIDREIGSGHHEVQWNSPVSHASGVYFYRLKTAEFEQTKKMVLMK